LFVNTRALLVPFTLHAPLHSPQVAQSAHCFRRAHSPSPAHNHAASLAYNVDNRCKYIFRGSSYAAPACPAAACCPAVPDCSSSCQCLCSSRNSLRPPTRAEGPHPWLQGPCGCWPGVLLHLRIKVSRHCCRPPGCVILALMTQALKVAACMC
jgi:hypothetical protein